MAITFLKRGGFIVVLLLFMSAISFSVGAGDGGSGVEGLIVSVVIAVIAMVIGRNIMGTIRHARRLMLSGTETEAEIIERGIGTFVEKFRVRFQDAKGRDHEAIVRHPGTREISFDVGQRHPVIYDTDNPETAGFRDAIIRFV